MHEIREGKRNQGSKGCMERRAQVKSGARFPRRRGSVAAAEVGRGVRRTRRGVPVEVAKSAGGTLALREPQTPEGTAKMTECALGWCLAFEDFADDFAGEGFF